MMDDHYLFHFSEQRVHACNCHFDELVQSWEKMKHELKTKNVAICLERIQDVKMGIEPVKHGTAQSQEESWNETASRKESDYVRKWINDNATEMTMSPILFVDDRDVSQVSPTKSSISINTKESVVPQVSSTDVLVSYIKKDSVVPKFSPANSSVSCIAKTSVGDKSLPTCDGRETEVICLDDSDAKLLVEIPRTNEGRKPTVTRSPLGPDGLIEIPRFSEQCSNEERSSDRASFAARKQQTSTCKEGEQQLAEKSVSQTNLRKSTKRNIPEHSFKVTDKYSAAPVIVLSDENDSDDFSNSDNNTNGSVASDSEVDRVCLRLLYPSLRTGRCSSGLSKNRKSVSHASSSRRSISLSRGSEPHFLGFSDDAETLQRSHPTNLCEGSHTWGSGSLKSVSPGGKPFHLQRKSNDDADRAEVILIDDDDDDDDDDDAADDHNSEDKFRLKLSPLKSARQTPKSSERNTLGMQQVGIIGSSNRSQGISSDSDSNASDITETVRRKRTNIHSSGPARQALQQRSKSKRENVRKQKRRLTGNNDRSSDSSSDSYCTISKTTERVRREKTSAHSQKQEKQKGHRFMRILASDKSSIDMSTGSETSSSEEKETARKEKTNIVKPVKKENEQGQEGKGFQNLDKDTREIIRQQWIGHESQNLDKDTRETVRHQWIRMVGNDDSLLKLSSDSRSDSGSDARNTVGKHRVEIARNCRRSSGRSEDSSSDSESIASEITERTKHNRSTVVLNDSPENEIRKKVPRCDKQMPSDDSGSHMTFHTETEQTSMNMTVSSDIIIIDESRGRFQEPLESQSSETEKRNGQLGVPVSQSSDLASISQISEQIKSKRNDGMGLDLPTESVGNENNSLGNQSCEEMKSLRNSGVNKDVAMNFTAVETTDTVIGKRTEQMFRKLPTLIAPSCIVKGTNAADRQYCEDMRVSRKNSLSKGISMNLTSVEQKEIVVDKETCKIMKKQLNQIDPCIRKESNASSQDASDDRTLSEKSRLSKNISIDLSTIEQNEIIVDEETYEEMKKLATSITAYMEKEHDKSVDEKVTISRTCSLNKNGSTNSTAVKENEFVVNKETDKLIIDSLTEDTVCSTKKGQVTVDHTYENVTMSRKGSLDVDLSMNLTSVEQRRKIAEKGTDKLIIDSLVEDTALSSKEGNTIRNPSDENMKFGNFVISERSNLNKATSRGQGTMANQQTIPNSFQTGVWSIGNTNFRIGTLKRKIEEDRFSNKRDNENANVNEINESFDSESSSRTKDKSDADSTTINSSSDNVSDSPFNIFARLDKGKSRDSGAARQLFGNDTGGDDLINNDSFVILNSSEELLIDNVHCEEDDTQYEKDNEQCEIEEREYERDDVNRVEDNRELAESKQIRTTTKLNLRDDISPDGTLKKEYVPSNLFEKLMEENKRNSIEVRPHLASGSNTVPPVPAKNRRDVGRYVDDAVKDPSMKQPKAVNVLEKFNISPCRVILSPCYDDLIKRPTSVSERIKINITKALNESASVVDNQSFVMSPVAAKFSNSHPFNRLSSFVELEAYDSDGSELSFTVEIDKVDETDDESYFASNDKECMPLSHMNTDALQNGEDCVTKKRRVDKVIGSIPGEVIARTQRIANRGLAQQSNHQSNRIVDQSRRLSDTMGAIYQKTASDSHAIGHLNMPKLSIDHSKQNSDGNESLGIKFTDQNDRLSTVYIVQRDMAKNYSNTQRSGKKNVPTEMSVPDDFRRRNPSGYGEEASSSDEFYLPRDFENREDSSDDCIRNFGRHTRRELRSCPHCRRKREELLNITKCSVWLERIDPTKYNLISHRARPRMNYKPRHRKELFSNKGTVAKSPRKLKKISTDLRERNVAKRRKNGKRKLSKAERTKLSIQRSLCFINKRITSQNSLNSLLKRESFKLLG